MLCGHFPFSTRNIEHEIQNSPVVFPDAHWAHISILCKHFILKLLDKCKVNRIQPNEALVHPWFELLKSDKDGADISPLHM